MFGVKGLEMAPKGCALHEAAADAFKTGGAISQHFRAADRGEAESTGKIGQGSACEAERVGL